MLQERETKREKQSEGNKETGGDRESVNLVYYIVKWDIKRTVIISMSEIIYMAMSQ